MEIMGIAGINWESLGTLSAVCFIIANVYYPARVIARNSVGNSDEVSSFLDSYKKVHILFNLLGVWAALFHGHFADENNWVLQTTIVIMIGLTISGLLMHYRLPNTEDWLPYLLTFQQVTFPVWIILVIAGHGMI